MQTVSVPTVNDNTNEELEEFSAQLSNPSEELVLGTDSSAQINIEDNDREFGEKKHKELYLLLLFIALSVQFEPATYSVQEGGGTNLVAVLNREADRNVSVVFNTQDGTAEGKTAYLKYTALDYWQILIISLYQQLLETTLVSLEESSSSLLELHL